MPCYLIGKIVITDEERLIEEASKFGIVLNKERAKEWIKLSFEQQINTKDIMRNYNIAKVKQAAQKKGWKVGNIKYENDKVIIRLRE